MGQEEGLNLLTDKGTYSDKITRNNFEFHYVVGRGGFGKVWKASYKKTGKVYAIKEMSKSKIIDKNSVKNIQIERDILSCLNSPWLSNLIYAFQDKYFLYIVMDYLTGGNLRYHLTYKKRFNEETTRFFIGCIILGLEYIHSQRILHRDIKPENLVLDQKGYVHIADFGIAKKLIPNNGNDTSGTMGYMAPETLAGDNHTYISDYYSLGIICFEFAFGQRPYAASSKRELKDIILTKQAQIDPDDLPNGWSSSTSDFINKLIQRKPHRRLGFSSINKVKEHKWFDKFKWNILAERKMKSPFIPTYIDNFDKKYCNLPEKIGDDTLERYQKIILSPDYEKVFAKFNSEVIPLEFRMNNNKVSSIHSNTQNNINSEVSTVTNSNLNMNNNKSNVNFKKNLNLNNINNNKISRNKEEIKNYSNVTKANRSVLSNKHYANSIHITNCNLNLKNNMNMNINLNLSNRNKNCNNNVINFNNNYYQNNNIRKITEFLIENRLKNKAKNKNNNNNYRRSSSCLNIKNSNASLINNANNQNNLNLNNLNNLNNNVSSSKKEIKHSLNSSMVKISHKPSQNISRDISIIENRNRNLSNNNKKIKLSTHNNSINNSNRKLPMLNLSNLSLLNKNVFLPYKKIDSGASSRVSSHTKGFFTNRKCTSKSNSRSKIKNKFLNSSSLFNPKQNEAFEISVNNSILNKGNNANNASKGSLNNVNSISNVDRVNRINSISNVGGVGNSSNNFKHLSGANTKRNSAVHGENANRGSLSVKKKK